jgi:DNA modification methylase
VCLYDREHQDQPCGVWGMTEHRIIQGDVLAGLATMPDNCIQCTITSPPYFNLRNYGVKGQIGLEESPEAFIQKMVEVFHEVRRVTRKDGVLWLNFGDSYSGSGCGSNDHREEGASTDER